MLGQVEGGKEERKQSLSKMGACQKVIKNKWRQVLNARILGDMRESLVLVKCLLLACRKRRECGRLAT